MRTPIRYAGGKSRAYDFISSYIPFWPRPKRIIRPFLGGGSSSDPSYGSGGGGGYYGGGAGGAKPS